MMRAALLAALVPGLALAAPVAYRLDPAETELVAITHPVGLFSGAAHPHAVLARGAEGRIVHDPSDPAASRVEVEVRTDALEVDDPALRRRYGLAGTLSDADRRKVAASMRARDQLDVAGFPNISFSSTAVRPLGEGRLEVSGPLTIRGRSAEIRVPVRVSVEGGVLRGEGTVHVTHAMFGIRPFSTAFGTVRNADGIDLHLTLVGRAEGAPRSTGSTSRAARPEKDGT